MTRTPSPLGTEEHWEEAARLPNARAHIHPSGVDDESYWRSGRSDFDRLRLLIGTDRDKRVFDFGCGDGRVTIPLACYYHSVAGVDTSPTMRENLEARAPIPTYKTLADASKDGGVADAVFSIAVLIHYRHHDAARLIGEMAAATRRGGVVVIWLPLYAEGREPESWIDLAVWRLEDLERVANEHGLVVVEAKTCPGTFSWEKYHEDDLHPNHEALTVLVKTS